MSSQLITLLNGVSSASVGSPYDLAAVTGYPHGEHTVQVIGISGDSVKIQGTIDDTNWHDVGTVFTLDGMQTFGGVWLKLRGNVTVYGSGNITMKVMFGILDSEVLTRLTSARALLLDKLVNLDATVSSRATSSVQGDMLNIYKEMAKSNVKIKRN